MKAIKAIALGSAIMGAEPCLGGDLARWERVLDRMEGQHAAISICRSAADFCTPEAELAIALLADGRVGTINRAVNRIVQRIAEPIDIWADPFSTLRQRSGDCEDYAILKYFLLRELGYSPVLLIVARDGRHHMVVSVRTANNSWIVLDNLTDVIVPFERYAVVWKVEKAL